MSGSSLDGEVGACADDLRARDRSDLGSGDFGGRRFVLLRRWFSFLNTIRTSSKKEGVRPVMATRSM